MKIQLKCDCGHLFSAEDDQADAPCPACHARVEVPTLDRPLVPPPESEKSPWMRVRCPCGKVVKAPHDWLGKKGRCPSCREPLIMRPADSSTGKTAIPTAAVNAPQKTEVSIAATLEEQTRRELERRAAEARERGEDPEAGSGLLRYVEGEQGDAETPAIEYTKSRSLGEWLADARASAQRILHEKPQIFAMASAGLILVSGLMVYRQVTYGHILPTWLTDSFETITPTPEGSANLVQATRENDLTQIKANLKNVSNVDTPDQQGMTPLKAACIRGNASVVSLLIDKGANVNDTDASGRTPLHWAAGSGRVEVVRLLLRRGAVVKPDASRHTPLDEARAFGHQQVVEVLEPVTPATAPANDPPEPSAPSPATESAAEPVDATPTATAAAP